MYYVTDSWYNGNPCHSIQSELSLGKRFGLDEIIAGPFTREFDAWRAEFRIEADEALRDWNNSPENPNRVVACSGPICQSFDSGQDQHGDDDMYILHLTARIYLEDAQKLAWNCAMDCAFDHRLMGNADIMHQILPC